MKKVFTLVVTLFLGATLALAQTGGDKSSLNPQPLPPGKSKATAQSTTPPAKTKAKGHKSAKKEKKSSAAATTTKSGETTPPPK
jgi:Ni/Co efflux regulator RcnB